MGVCRLNRTKNRANVRYSALKQFSRRQCPYRTIFGAILNFFDRTMVSNGVAIITRGGSNTIVMRPNFFRYNTGPLRLNVCFNTRSGVSNPRLIPLEFYRSTGVLVLPMRFRRPTLPNAVFKASTQKRFKTVSNEVVQFFRVMEGVQVRRPRGGAGKLLFFFPTSSPFGNYVSTFVVKDMTFSLPIRPGFPFGIEMVMQTTKITTRFQVGELYDQHTFQGGRLITITFRPSKGLANMRVIPLIRPSIVANSLRKERRIYLAKVGRMNRNAITISVKMGPNGGTTPTKSTSQVLTRYIFGKGHVLPNGNIRVKNRNDEISRIERNVNARFVQIRGGSVKAFIREMLLFLEKSRHRTRNLPRHDGT